MTTAWNLDAKSNAIKPYVVVSGTTINQGDQVYWNSTGVASSTSDANNQYFVGMAMDSYPASSSIDSSSAIGVPTHIMVRRAGIVKFLCHGTITFTDGDAVYYSTDAQHITNSGSYIIGRVALGCESGLTESYTVTFTDGQLVPVELTTLWPVATTPLIS